jgi:hypothetical protein
VADGHAVPPEHSGSVESPDEGEIAKWKEPWQNYGLSLLFIGIVPLLPIIIELFVSGRITEDSLIIAAAIYSIAVALASNNRFYFGSFFVASIVESAIYGSVAKANGSNVTTGRVLGLKISSDGGSALSDNKYIFIAIILPFASVLVERFSRHVRNREEFFEFLKGRGI